MRRCKMTRYEKISELIAKIKAEVSPMEVMNSRVEQVQARGPNIVGLCPFHNDRHVGSFVANQTRGVSCFACGYRANDIIQFTCDWENKYGKHSLDYVGTAIAIAREKNFITESEFEWLSKRKLSSADSLKLETQYKKQELPKPASEDVLDQVYSLFIKGEEYRDLPRLSTEHREALHQRGLTDEEIDTTGYFTFPKRFISRRFFKDLESHGISLDVLQKVPGFFYDEVKENYDFTTYSTSGIGIPIRNEKGKIVAIQIRKDTTREGEQRYTWFSSSWVMGKKKKRYGCSCGAPVDVHFPKKQIGKDIWITEGHFKARKITETFGVISLAVQGVSSWRNILPILKGYSYEKIVIAFDADMAYNEGVFMQAMKMGLTLSQLNFRKGGQLLIDQLGRKNVKQNPILKGVYDVLHEDYMNPTGGVREKSKCKQILFAFWDVSVGKGIDDFLEQSSKDEIHYYNLAIMYTKYLKYLFLLEEKYETISDQDDIPKEERENLFYQAFDLKLPTA